MLQLDHNNPHPPVTRHVGYTTCGRTPPVYAMTAPPVHTVTHMDKVRLMGAAEIQARLGVSRQWAYELIARRSFPAPYATLAMGSVWAADDVEAWIRQNRPELAEDAEEAQPES